MITGGSGLLGSNLVKMAASDFEVYATYHTHLTQIPGSQFMRMDTRDKKRVLSIFEKIKPHLVIHTAGLVNVDYCEKHEDEAWSLNVYGTENITLATEKINAKLIYISTDSIFDGKKGMYTEKDIPNPHTAYAKTKLAGEEIVKRRLSNSIIARTVFYGWSLHSKKSLAEWIITTLKEKKRLKLWADAFFTPILVNNLAEVLLTMYRQDLNGTYHVGGSERCSKYVFGLGLARVFKLDSNLIEPSSISETGSGISRPKDPSLDSTKVSRELATKLLDIRQGITLFKELEIHHGKRNSKKALDFMPYGHHWLDDADINAVVEVLRNDWITQGPKADEFERKVAEYCGAKYAVAVSSGTAALHAACAVVGISKGDEVITTTNTFAATANAIVYCGGKPIFADIDDTLNIDPEDIRSKLSSTTKAIIPVDFAGHPANLGDIKEIAKEHNLVVIEDAAHALGADYNGHRIGSISDMTVLSFHPVKHITTGEGGMILTNNQEYYERLKIFRHHGIRKNIPGKPSWYYEIENLGHNFRITDFQCALGISQMNKLDGFIKRRREIAARYNKAFAKMAEIITPPESDNVKAVYHLYVIQLQPERLKIGRKEIFEALRQKNIGIHVHYLPVHLHPYYRREFGYKVGDYPKAEGYYERTLTLPAFPKMSDDDVAYVIDTVKRTILHSI